jgi:hypothetical protein
MSALHIARDRGDVVRAEDQLILKLLDHLLSNLAEIRIGVANR